MVIYQGGGIVEFFVEIGDLETTLSRNAMDSGNMQEEESLVSEVVDESPPSSVFYLEEESGTKMLWKRTPGRQKLGLV